VKPGIGPDRDVVAVLEAMKMQNDIVATGRNRRCVHVGRETSSPKAPIADIE